MLPHVGLRLLRCQRILQAAVTSSGCQTASVAINWTGDITTRHNVALQRIQFSSDTTGQPQTGTGHDPAEDYISRMLDQLVNDPNMQQVLMSRMPPGMRKPEVMRAMLQDPATRKNIIGIAKKQGLGDLLAEGKDATPTNLPMGNASGLDISKLMAKFTSSPEIMAKWSKPHVRAALMDVFRHGPEALKKYEQDSEVMDAFTECLEMMQDVQPDTTNRPQQASQEAPASASTDSSSQQPTSSSTSTPSAASAEDPFLKSFGVSTHDLMRLLVGRPALLAKVEDTKIQTALSEVVAHPWKMIKYLFDREVMSVFKELKTIIQEARAKKT
eukprot:jgi/Chrzof1/7326/Cz02g19150.t1_TIC40A[v5.2]